MLGKLFKKLFYPNSSPSLKSVVNSNKLVLVLGWGGSKPRNYAKIMQYYESKGVSTILHIMPMLCPKAIRNSYEKEIAKLVDENKFVFEAAGKNNLFVHLYSQNGAWTYSSLIKSHQIPIPRKIIMDSAPCFHYERDYISESVELSKLFTSLILNKAQYYHYLITPTIKSVLYGVMYLSTITDKLFQAKFYFFTNYIELHKYFRDSCPVIPTLFICSHGDQLIKPQDVEAFKHELEKRGVPVSEFVFGEDVSHISAMFIYPKQYFRLIDEFFELDDVRN